MSPIAVCIKWTVREPDADRGDERFAGVSHADQAALEVALTLAAQLGGAVTAVTVGPAAADRALRDALACGASAVVRVDTAAELESIDVAAELAAHLGEAGIVVCGDYSTDRGSGSVPAFLAHHLGVAQALGLVAIEHDGADLRGVRRLDGGRREILRVPQPCVLSVEGSVADLRRAGLRATLTSNSAAIDVRSRVTHRSATTPTLVTPYRPRARVLPPPAGTDVLDRLRALTDAGGAPAHGETVTLPPREAAERIMQALRDWGELE